MRKNFIPVKSFNQWHRLPREVVQPPSLELFRTGVDEAMRTNVQPHAADPAMRRKVG